MPDRKISSLDRVTDATQSDFFLINTNNTKTNRISLDDLSSAIGAGKNLADISAHYPIGVTWVNATVDQNVDAFNSANAASGGVVYFPPGIYNFIGRQIILQNAATIYGDGPKLALINFGNTTTDGFVVDHSSEDMGQFRMKGLTVYKEGTGSHINYISRGDINTHQVIIEDIMIQGQSESGIRLQNGTFVTLRDVHVIPGGDSIQQGIIFENGPGPGDITSTNCLVDNCVFRNFNTGILIRGVSEGISIVNSQFINMNKGINVAILTGGEPFIYVSGCHFDVKEIGIELSNVIQSKIVNNDIRRHGTGSWTGIVLDAGGSGSNNFMNIITGNTFGISVVGGSARTGVFVNDSVYTSISQNIFHYMTTGVNVDVTYDPLGSSSNFNIWLLDNMFFETDDPYSGTMFSTHQYDGAQPHLTRGYYIVRNPKAYSGDYFRNYGTFDDLKTSNIGVVKGDNPNGPDLLG